MKLLVFEYSTVYPCSNLKSEGFNMIKCILNDLDKAEIKADYLISSELSVDTDNNPIIVDNLIDWLKKNSDKYTHCIYIAPEDDLIQYEIACILQKNNVEIIGSGSDACFICSSKNRTYNHIRGVLKIPSLSLNITSICYEDVDCFIKKYKTCIIKPDDKTSSDCVYKINSMDEFEDKVRIYERKGVLNFLIQQYIEGCAVSISAICNNKKSDCISMNLQNMKNINNQIKYAGCITPIKHPVYDKLVKISQDIIKQVDDLRGFVGIDYIIDEADNIYFVEINSRFTTPFIVLSHICDCNLTKCIIDNVLYDKKVEVKLTGKDEFNI